MSTQPSSNTQVHLIAAVSDNSVIGINNTLPWHLPEDLQFFKATTQGAPIIMGRKTYESIGRPLPGRLNIVISGTQGWLPEKPLPATCGNHGELSAAAIEQWLAEPTTGYASSTSLEAALTACQPCANVYIIGGAQLYQYALPLADQLILTEVHTTLDGDAFFPQWDKAHYREVWREAHAATPERPWSFDFVKYQSVSAGAHS